MEEAIAAMAGLNLSTTPTAPQTDKDPDHGTAGPDGSTPSPQAPSASSSLEGGTVGRGPAEPAPACSVPPNTGSTEFDVDSNTAPPLRWYQHTIVDKLKQRLTRHFCATGASAAPASTLVTLPTGAGKTRVACEVMRWCTLDGRRCVFVVNRNKLAAQAMGALASVGLAAASAQYKSGAKEDLTAPVQVTSIQSLRSASRTYPPADLVIVDEAHCAVSPSYLAMCRHYRTLGAFVVGLTATPVRLDPTESLSTVFQRTLRGPSVHELVELGVLVRPVVYSLPHTEAKDALRAFRRANGGRASRQRRSTAHLEDTPEELAVQMATRRMVRRAVKAWRRTCRGRPTICFCTSIVHSQAVAAAFVDAGVPAQHVDGTMSERTREAAFAALHEGTVSVLCSVNVLTEGFDEPLVSAVMMLRPTASKGLYVGWLAGASVCLVCRFGDV